MLSVIAPLFRETSNESRAQESRAEPAPLSARCGGRGRRAATVVVAARSSRGRELPEAAGLDVRAQRRDSGRMVAQERDQRNQLGLEYHSRLARPVQRSLVVPE